MLGEAAAQSNLPAWGLHGLAPGRGEPVLAIRRARVDLEPAAATMSWTCNGGPDAYPLRDRGRTLTIRTMAGARFLSPAFGLGWFSARSSASLEHEKVGLLPDNPRIASLSAEIERLAATLHHETTVERAIAEDLTDGRDGRVD